MRWREALNPVDMERVALLAPREQLRPLLASLADLGTVELDDTPAEVPLRGGAGERLQRLGAGETTAAVLSPTAPDLDACQALNRVDLIAGEAELETRAAQAVTRGSVVALLGWTPHRSLTELSGRLEGAGGVAVPLPRPAGAQPPTLLAQTGTAREFAPLVETYATVPYADVNPSVVAGLAYVVMFGMMFADVGHGALLVLAAIAVRMGWSARLSRLRPVWLFLAGSGVASIAFGALYGEFFGPTGLLPVLWLQPLDEPVRLLAAGVIAGGVLLAGAYALGTVNRFREGGWRRAAYAPSGLAGSTVFLGLAGLAAGALGPGWLIWAGGLLTVSGLVVAYVGLLAAAGGGAGGASEAAIELVDLVVRIASNVVSFARLAAFGLTHAALGAVIWDATSGLADRGGLAVVGAAVVFLIGNVVAFALEGLVAGIQALRLEYYELFSRIFDSEGRPFRPWHVPLTHEELPW